MEQEDINIKCDWENIFINYLINVSLLLLMEKMLIIKYERF